MTSTLAKALAPTVRKAAHRWPCKPAKIRCQRASQFSPRSSWVVTSSPVGLTGRLQVSDRAMLGGDHRYAAQVSELLPNLDDLTNYLPGDSAGQRDARLLVEAVANASTEDDIDEALDTVIATWRQL